MSTIQMMKKKLKQLLGRELAYEVEFECQKEMFGSQYGGYVVNPENLSKNSIIYSFGVGEDITFDLSLINKYGVNIYAFDPTPKSVEWVNSQMLPKEFRFYQYGISDYDGKAKFNPPDNPKYVSYTLLPKKNIIGTPIEVDVYRLSTILNMLGHTKIDILKMDIEGAEYAVINDIINSKVDISQLLIEFHHRFKNVGVKKTEEAIVNLKAYGFKIFYISDSGEEYSFIKS